MCFLEVVIGGLSFAMFLKCDVVTFKETIYLLSEYCVEDGIGSAVCLAQFAHQAHSVFDESIN